MNHINPNTWLANDSKGLIDYYTGAADVIVVERKRIIKLLLDIFSYYFKDTINLTIVDFGCGDGTITKCFTETFPDNHYILIDGSPDMLERAQDKLKTTNNVTFVCQSFEKYIDNENRKAHYDFVFSSNAIHHLDANGKAKLYFKIYLDLNPGGLFINYDVIMPPTQRTEQWQFQMWRDWMNEQLIALNKPENIGTHDSLPDIYKAKQDNHPGSLLDQLEILQKIGFKDVDCFFKYGIFALFGGIK